MLPGCGFLACTQSSGEEKYLLQKQPLPVPSPPARRGKLAPRVDAAFGGWKPRSCCWREAVPWWGAGGQGPPGSPEPCVAPVVLGARPSCGKCTFREQASAGAVGMKLCGSALSPRQDLTSVPESFPPLGHRKTRPWCAGIAPGAAGLGVTAGALALPQRQATGESLKL